MRRISVPLALAFLLAPGAALAQSCGGVFTDVPAADPFCPNVEWILNRGITTGCTATTYCPTNPVTRLQMAAFLNRMGRALTPEDVTPGVTAPTAATSPAGNPVLCQTADYPVTGYPRRAIVAGSAVLSGPSASIDVRAAIAYSTNGGTTWTAIPNSDQYVVLTPGLTPVDRSTLSPFGAVNLNVGQNVRFGVQLGQFAGSGTITAACNTQVQIWNRNGTSAPFDVEALSMAPSRSGG
jgi:hypothetical protein